MHTDTPGTDHTSQSAIIWCDDPLIMVAATLAFAFQFWNSTLNFFFPGTQRVKTIVKARTSAFPHSHIKPLQWKQLLSYLEW